jgi:hypothetical protein
MRIYSPALWIAVAALFAAPAMLLAEHEFFGKTDVGDVVERIERHGDEFEKVFDRGVNRMDLKEKDRYKDWADNLEKAVDDLKEEYNDKNFGKARANLEEAMLVAASINRLMLREPFVSEAQRAWGVLRDDLNVLATAAGIPALPNLFITVTSVR